MTNNPATNALILSLIAGISTMGALLFMYVPKKHHDRIMFISISFASGVMFCISLGELLPDSIEIFQESFGGMGVIFAVLLMGAGYLLTDGLDKMLEKFFQSGKETGKIKGDYNPMAVLTLLALTVHNFPEGMATFSAALDDVGLGVSIAFSIALHNIPEGVSIISSVYKQPSDKKTAFIYMTIASLAEPLGALTAYFFLYKYMTPVFMAGIFAVISGIMVYICLNELFVEAIHSGQKGFGRYAFWGICFMYLVKII
ncbi:MAG: ZIP family metal transporter [Eubacteriaceae bacterium]|nr:ZIP family metal transporter [Eubacteriaceae bacterium]